ncbi:MAG: hypothetical protein R3F07_15980 [Opitutaceae bacterium]
MGTMKNVRYKGNAVSFTEYGRPSGFPVIIQHGLIASIEDGHLFQPLVDAGLRLLCVARPGYGSSTAFALRNIAEWAAVTEFLVTALSMKHFDILAMSSGAPYGYAIANGLRSRTRNLFIFSGTPALYNEEVRAIWPYPLDGDRTLPELQQLAHELFFPGVSEDTTVAKDVRDSMRNNCFGPALDLFYVDRTGGFRCRASRSRSPCGIAGKTTRCRMRQQR